jgi:hypothetical protein
MANCSVKLGDIGTVFELEIQDCGKTLDISSASSQEIIFVKPNGAEVSHTSQFSTDGTNGKIQYITISGDIDKVGTWGIKGKVTLSAPAGEWTSTTATFDVEKP